VSEPSNPYRTVVVGTDGSQSSVRAVGRAGAVAGACGATLVVACACLPTETDDRELARAQDVLGDEAYQVVGSHPAEDTVRTAAERAARADATRRSQCDVLVMHTTG
jgi:nucleotide-binding universal stress UspA family protein